ncbi:MAG: VWA domain-containing protein, partial [Actinomycetota bacterium]
MTARSSSRLRSVFGPLAALVVLCASAAPLWAAPSVVGDEVTITRVDVAGFPAVGIEISAPAGVVGALAPTDVSVTENGLPVKVDMTRVPANRLEVVLLLDISGSMAQGRAINAAKAAAVQFLNSLPPEVAVGVVAFNGSVKLISALSTDRVFLASAINGVEAFGETALYDAILFAPTLFSGGTTDRQMVVLSDGGDTVSHASLADAVAVAGKIRTSAVELVSSEANHGSLAQLTAADSGTLSSVTDPAALGGLYQKIANALVNRFRLSFTSTASGQATYVVKVKTKTATLTATATATLPAVVATTAPPNTVATTTTSTLAPTATSVKLPEESTGALSKVSTSTLLALGAAAFFRYFASLDLPEK